MPIAQKGRTRTELVEATKTDDMLEKIRELAYDPECEDYWWEKVFLMHTK